MPGSEGMKEARGGRGGRRGGGREEEEVEGGTMAGDQAPGPALKEDVERVDIAAVCDSPAGAGTPLGGLPSLLLMSERGQHDS